MTTTISRAGGPRPTAHEHPLVATTTADDFSAAHLLRLLKGDVYALRVAGLIDEIALEGLRAVFVGRDDHGPLATDPQFRRLGYAFSETTPGQESEYFDRAADHRRELRAAAAPHPYPSDLVRILLDEAWPSGATLLGSESRKFFAGVVRYQRAGVDLEPHTDNVARNLPDGEHSGGLGIRRQLSVNVYLDVPDAGGELEIWDSYPTEECYRELSGDRVWGIDRSAVGEPAITIEPAVGEAIFIDPRRVHAVAPSEDRPRVTVGLFVGVRADEQPLAVWS